MMRSRVVLGIVITLVLNTWFSIYYKLTLCNFIPNPKKLFMNLDLRNLIVKFIIPTTMKLSVSIRVGGCVCTRSSRVFRNNDSLFCIVKETPSSASAANVIIFRMMCNIPCSEPFDGGVEVRDLVVSLEGELK